MEDVDQGAQGNDNDQPSGMAPRRLIIDTDPGVDDAVAIVALLNQRRYQVEVLGIATVAGNADALSGANNALNILKSLGRTDILWPSVPMRLWSVPRAAPANCSGLTSSGNLQKPQRPERVGAGCCGQLLLRASLLGRRDVDRTGTARNVAACRGAMSGKNAHPRRNRLLGRGKFGGNITPAAEYNVWQDPEAFAAVLDFVKPTQFRAPPQPALTVVPVDAFSQLTITSKDVEARGRQTPQWPLWCRRSNSMSSFKEQTAAPPAFPMPWPWPWPSIRRATDSPKRH
ncbi:MAG: nucleoside hydrolase [Caldilineaceae bacterium]